MKVYIASNFADKDRVASRCKELNALGIETTSRWALETAPHDCKITDKPAQYMRETAVFDIEDILVANKLILTVPSAEQLVNLTPHQMSRGGRVFESGMMYGLILADWLAYGERFVEDISDIKSRKELIVMGEKENVFHFLDGADGSKNFPKVTVLPNWEDVKNYLVAQLQK